MADLAEFLKQGLKGILKNKQPNRVELKKLDRKAHRTDMLNAKRQIKDSPLPPTPDQVLNTQQKPSRIEMLKKWKQERDQRKLEENAKKKPIFKVCHVDVKQIYKELKGKPLKTPQSPLKFVGSSHKFIPPRNIKPIQFDGVSNTERAVERGRITRSQSQQSSNTARKLNFNSDKQLLEGSTKIKEKTLSTKPLREKRANSKETASKSDRVLRNNVQKSKSTSNDQLSIKEKLHSDTNKKMTLKKLKSSSSDQLSNKENVDSIKIKLPSKKDLSAAVAKETRSKKTNARLPEQKNEATKAKKTNAKQKNSITKEENHVMQDTFPLEYTDKMKKEDVSTVETRLPDCTSSEKTTGGDVIIDANICETNSRNPLNIKSESTSSSLSSDYPIVDVVDTTENESPVFIESSITPKSKPNELVYVSPFVTMSRGKNKARDEFKSRSSRGGLSLESPEATGSKAGAQYFCKALDDEISRINGVCDEWNNYKDETNAPEEVCDMINVAIGQSNLLISKRMQQFRGLIDSCRDQNTDPLITCGDLHGFWDLLLIQVGNLNSRFENLNKLRANNWEEILPEKKVATKKKQVTKKNKPKPSSALREAIKAARAKKHVDDTLTVQNVFDGGFFKVTSPRKSLTSNKTPAKTRKSLLQSVLTSEVSKRLTSPGLSMMKVTQTAKCLDTPTKSILKPINSKSTGKKSKAVIFKEEIVDEKIVNEEIVASMSRTTIDEEKSHIPNIVNSETKIGNVRRSTRLTRSKLF